MREYRGRIGLLCCIPFHPESYLATREMTMPSQPDRVYAESRRSATHLLDGELSRRDLGKLAAALAPSATLAAGAPRLGAAQSGESTPATSPDRPRGGSVTLAMNSDADTLDPQLTLNFSSICAYNNIFDTLVGIGKD